MTELKKQIEELIIKANDAKQSHDALHFSQAALNAANALRQLNDTK